MKKYHQPTISVVISNYNGLVCLKTNLPAVVQACQPYEIILVDDASTDNSLHFVRQQYPAIKCLVNNRNIGFAATVNRGVKTARGELVLLLNNDVLPDQGFLLPMIKVFQNRNVFSVGPAEIDRIKGKKIISGKSWGCVQQGILVHGRCAEQVSGETAWVQGGSMLVKKDIFIKLGGFDPLFAPGYWEDIDLGWRAKQAGYDNCFCAESKVHHQHGTTFGKLFDKREIELLSYRNSLLFCWKNFKGRLLTNHLCWLPYQLVIKGIQTKGLYINAFIKALQKFLSIHD